MPAAFVQGLCIYHFKSLVTFIYNRSENKPCDGNLFKLLSDGNI